MRLKCARMQHVLLLLGCLMGLLVACADAQAVSSPLCDAQNACTCWTNTTATQVPSCYSPKVYTCPSGTKLVPGTEASCSIPKGGSATPPPPPPPPPPTPTPTPPPPTPGPPPPPPPSPGTLTSSPVCDAQNACTCWTNTTATQVPSCYSPKVYTCPSGTKLVPGTEASCSIPKGGGATPPPPPPPTPTPTPPPPTPGPPPPPPSGGQVLFADEFTTLDTSVWGFELGDGSDYGIPGWGNNELECYTASPANAAIIPNPDNPADGVLRIRSIYSSTPQPCVNRNAATSQRQWTSARLLTRGTKTFAPIVNGSVCTPITLEARMRFAGKAGQWGAFWALGVSGTWPKNGEIDVVEHVNKDASVLGTMHFADPNGNHQQLPAANRYPVADPYTAWHTYAVSWGCDFMAWVVDGKQVSRVDKAQVNVWAFSQPFYLLLNQAVGGNLPGNTVDTSGGDMLVDYVRVYTQGGSATPPPTPPPPPPAPVPPPPAPIGGLTPSPVCDAQNACTCWTNTTATQVPSCYSPSMYTCPSGTKLVPGSEASCSIPRGGATPPPPPPTPTPPPPTPGPPPPAIPAACGVPTASLGTQVAPVAGTLTPNGSPATAASLPPFAMYNNTLTPGLIRMPASAAADPNGLLTRPVPTSAWWTNIMWSGPANNPTYGGDPVQIFPYHIQLKGPPKPTTAAADRGLWFCKPFYTGDNSGGVIMASFNELQLTLKEIQDPAASPAITAHDWDDLSLTMRYNATPSAASLLLPIVKGSPYITAEVPTPAQPVVRAPGGGAGASLVSVTQPAPNKLKLVVGSVPADGTHTWLLWASKPISFTQASGSISIAGTDSGAAGTFTGVLRLAWVPNAGAAGAAAIEAMLDQYAGTYPVGGSVAAWSNAATATSSYSLSWAAKAMSGASNSSASDLLMLALPHHVDTLASPTGTSAAAFPLGVAAAGAGTTAGSTVYTSAPAATSGRAAQDYGAFVMTVRGPQVPVVGSCWLLREGAVPLGLGGETEAAANLKNAAWRTNIEQTLMADLPLVLPPASLPAGDPFADWPAGPRAWPWKGMMNVDAYFGGSEMAAMGRLIYIAKALADTAAAAGSPNGPAAVAAAANLTNALGMLLQKKLTLPCAPVPPGGGANPGALCYDGTFKLITTARALAATDDGLEFFSRTGTDHHFHWGYWVAAAAAVAGQNAAWYRTNLAAAVSALIRDYANNDKADPLLPFARHKDWYMGHSWAAGLQLSADGKNQESSSEAVNAYAAIAQLGRATGDAVLEGWGQLLLANEVTAARKYTQVYTGNDLYKQIAGGSANNGISKAQVATILFAGKASAYNWFDPDILTRHAIQYLPFSPVSTQLLPAAWLKETVPMVTAGTTMATNRSWSPSDGGGGAVLGWRVLLAMAQAVVPGQQAAAWDALAALPIDASGGFSMCGTIGRNTRTAAKWWIATRP